MSDETVRVTVTVTEDGVVVARREITYYPFQEYRVELVTREGEDWEMPWRKAGVL